MRNIREKALFIIDSVFNKGAFLEEELDILRKGKISDRDFAFVREISSGVIRNRSYIDYIIEKNSSLKIKRIHKIIFIILEMGIYQMYFLDKVPNYSTINESVNLAKIYGNRGSASFVNGILRAISRKEREKVTIKDSIENLSIFYSHPKFYTEHLYKNYGEGFTKKLLKANNEIPDFVIRANTLKISREELLNILSNEGFSGKKGLFKESLVIENPREIFNSRAFKAGYFYAQDLSSIRVSQLLNPKKNSKILDLCASPGGKTTHLSALMENTGEILACDVNKFKIKTIRENAERLGSKNIKTMVNDASIFKENFKDYFDYVLVDAPCSAIGLYRRKPDIKWNKSLEDIKTLAGVQKKILNNAGSYVKKGGAIIYSTCSLSFEENEEVVKEFLKTKDFEIDKIEGKEIFRLYPFEGCDGFSITRLIRKA
ncbi:16S rRNA (cytosine(967)-C(5))-methyltransferase RsmB [uncultured Peptoniphilus sp.]|uniref:16S rRNA (cytosine(967)-C(5))-methyltransferase RsmB n=1 Tax=uncultured Peptoniphilus sp. TaxID=254354 RepID=UPI00280561CB|nr:16S rRNA (cytosine(967)-C(5))-methyltransferase RsmB [uncultured Peptoniphilus sp.]